MIGVLTVAAVIYGVVTVVIFVIFTGFYFTSHGASEAEDAARIARGAPLWPLALALGIREMLATAREAAARDEMTPAEVVVERRQLALEALPRCAHPGCDRTDLGTVWLDSESDPLNLSAVQVCPEHVREINR